jgi:nucleotide-binding universal stress UspA family protein
MSGPLLIAYDGSEDGANAIAAAGHLLVPRPALVVHSYVGFSRILVRTDPRPEITGPLAEAVAQLRADDREEAERLALEGARLAGEAGLDAEPVTAEQDGGAWRTILALAKERGVSAIVAGARGRSGVKSALLGNVSTGLVHHSDVPVLVVPVSSGDQATGPVLLCYDDSENARHAIEQAGQLAANKEATVLHVWQSWVPHAPTYVPVVSGAIGSMARELDEIADEQSSELTGLGVAAATAANFDADSVSERCNGAVWQAILESSDRADASLIVLGSRGMTGLSAVLGSVSHGVLHHSERPVLIVPPAGGR